MEILVVGGTRFVGVHLVKNLLNAGHSVTIATRGIAQDGFGGSVKRIILDRAERASMQSALAGKRFDAVFDSLAYSSTDVKNLLDFVQCTRYIETSTMSVYTDFEMGMREDGFDPLAHELWWCTRADAGYDEVKRQAECAARQEYARIPSAQVRFPYIVGEDDYTGRLYSYVENALKGVAMNIDNLNAPMSFIPSSEAGAFLAFLAGSGLTGAVNACSDGTVTLAGILDYVQAKTGRTAILSAGGQAAPYNGTPPYSLDTQKAKSAGFNFTNINSWLYDLIDEYIKRALASLG